MRKSLFLSILLLMLSEASFSHAFADALPHVVARVVNSVCRVEIRRYGENPDSVWERLWKEIYERNLIPQTHLQTYKDGTLKEKLQSDKLPTGSCAVLDTDKEEVLTNHHVVQDAVSILVFFAYIKGGIPATVRYSDPKSDITVLSVPGMKHLQKAPLPVTFGKSSLLRPGETIFGIGFPFGGDWQPNGAWAPSVIRGIVSIQRLFKFWEWVQTDAPLDPGYSGGAMFNISGEYVGMFTSAAPSGRGINYAITSDFIQKIIFQFRLYGSVKRGALGISLDRVNAILAYPAFRWGTTPEIRMTYGFMPIVTGLISGGPAGSAGIQSGDIILEINGAPVETVLDLERRVVQQHHPGEKITLLLLRNGAPKTVTVVLGDYDIVFRDFDGSVL